MEQHQSALALVLARQPELPVQALRPHAAEAAAREFVAGFAGDVLYAVKANPSPVILDAIYRGGVRRFDVASLPEIETIAQRYPDASIAFLHPIKSPRAIARAYFELGVRVFALDSFEELEKIRRATGGARDLQLIVRLAADSRHARHKLSRKFGVSGRAAAELLRATRGIADELGVSFHVGSQCMSPSAFADAMARASETIRAAGATVDIVDVGGGFPCPYPDLTPPPLADFLSAIATAFEEMPVLENADLWCEPGRALCAEAGTQIVRVEGRKGNSLYLNDGAYGSLFDAAHTGLIYPVARLGADAGAALEPFEFYGPTCDSLDHMPGPFYLPGDIAAGDYIEIGQTGAYSAALRTRFNGFGAEETVILKDAPLIRRQDDQSDPAFLPAANDPVAWIAE